MGGDDMSKNLFYFYLRQTNCDLFIGKTGFAVARHDELLSISCN